MKGKIKTLIVFVIIAAIAMFTAVATAWDNGHDGDHWKHFIWGKYAYTGGGNCLISPNGFTNDEPYVPNAGAFPSLVVVGGLITLNKDGSGSIQNVTRFLDLPGVINIGNEKWTFMYKPTHDNRFTIYANQGSYVELDWVAGPNASGPSPNYFVFDGSCDGVLSPYGDTVTITCGKPLITLKLASCDPTKSPPCTPLTGLFGACSFSWVGTRVGD
jgi:hypothetical protein